MTITNLFEQIPNALPDECISVLLSQSNVRVERIVSRGQSTPAGQWYEQTEHEWVMVLQGSGIIEYENCRQIVLNTGDYLYLPAHIKHRVAATAEHEYTIWLAIFWS